jgi:Flp pilus assembly protein TadB
MAQKNNFLGNLFSSTPNFFSQLVFGLLLAIIIKLVGASIAVSLCLGIIGGFVLGWFTTANENSAAPQTVASNDGIDAAMKYWVFFLLGFVFLGYPAILSIFLGIIGAIGGGWTIAWWRSLEVTRTQIVDEIKTEEDTPESSEKTVRKSRRKPTPHFRRKFANKSGSNPFRFW